MNTGSAPFSIVAGDGACLCSRCFPGERLLLDTDACAAVLREGDVQLYMPRTLEPFIAPQEPGTLSCIVSLDDVKLRVGFQNMLSYCASGAPGSLFRLGFHGEMTVWVAHIRGFSEIIRRALSRGTPQVSLFSLLADELRPLVIAALVGVLGEAPPDYQQILGQRAALQTAVEQAIFSQLYTCGLCIRPHSFVIQGFSKPTLLTGTP